MYWTDVEGTNAFAYGLDLRTCTEGSPNSVQRFSLLTIVHIKEQC